MEINISGHNLFVSTFVKYNFDQVLVEKRKFEVLLTVSGFLCWAIIKHNKKVQK
jgi:hypothetical protein